MIEKERGKEFVHSLYEDLHEDTAIIRISINRAERMVLHMDSAIQIFQQNHYDSATLTKLYRLNLGYLTGLGTVLTDRTSSQLKNAGGMRLVANDSVVERIIDYWNSAAMIEAMGPDVNEWRTQARARSYLIFDSKYYSTVQVNGRSTIIGSPLLMTTDYNVLTEFSNRLVHVKNLVLNRYIPQLNNQIREAEALMELIRKEYDLKN